MVEVAIHEHIHCSLTTPLGVGKADAQPLQTIVALLDRSEAHTAGSLQAAVARTLRREGLWTNALREQAERVLGHEEEATLFGLVQFLTGRYVKEAPEEMRLNRERAAGRVLLLGN